MKNTTTLIGITGNIATGKSVVRRMLANTGALSLDADVIAHRMIYSQGPAFQAVLSTFGNGILNQRGEIDRPKLGEIVFSDPDQLENLESIVHPAVTRAIHHRLARAQTPLAALEAIKLLEAGLDEICDAVWVSHVPREVQLERLMETRGLTEKEAQARIDAQPPQHEKLDQADLVIDTHGPFQHTWMQVIGGLNDKIHEIDLLAPLSRFEGNFDPSISDQSDTQLQRFWEDHAGGDAPSLYEALGTWMVEPWIFEDRLQALLLWKDWNFTAALTRVLPEEALLEDSVSVLEAFSTPARRQNCEMLLLSETLVQGYDLNPSPLGYNRRKPSDLAYPAWRDAAQALAAGDVVWAKILGPPLEKDVDFQIK